MTVDVDVERAHQDAGLPSAPRSGGRRWTIVAGLLVLMLLMAFTWWVTHPERFTYGNALGADDVHVGESIVFDSGIAPGVYDDEGKFTAETVGITEVSPRITRNDAEAKVVLLSLIHI